MEHLDTALDESCIIEEGSTSTGRMGRRSYDDTKEHKSKNLHAERRRRQKLSDRLLKLRALVPRITNMNKATIIEDAITYIQELQKNVKILQEQLCELELEVSSEGGAIDPASKVKVEAAEEMKKSGIQVEVEVTQIDRDKLWVKVIFEKKRGGFTTLMEAMSAFGFEFINTNVTTSKGAMLVSSCVKGIYGEKLAVQQTRELLLQIINGVDQSNSQ
ncbi:transcription factor DYT1-like [Juglans microcarpa x Juglans regia]|uniref:transcription factor DYT1-like n=1 Tax=Juglans microcarpa x Juglans regia TaxID=2249226 RepID=UPI001B7E7751|nr:transcription factor DYT1-like [Juglans microcarpa x Juglans regia]